ncbi:hypothetical protein, partial [Mesorhizobium sp.]|uniref:hypothetical protein n=1 Tax=Mesorhizobium sp. TaxID=1871066 RepID=UPI0025BB2926
RAAALLLAFERASISAEAADRQLSGLLLYVALPPSNSRKVRNGLLSGLLKNKGLEGVGDSIKR